MRSFSFRGYEIHSSRMWMQGQVDLALNFAKEYGLNALIFHENDLVSQLVFPEKYFNNDVMWDYWPVRRQGILNRRDYINQVIKKAQSMGIDFYLEIKEIDTVDAIFEIHPELRNSDGTICPNHPFWLEYMDTRLTELFELYPGIAGIIVSIGTRESQVSIAANRCTCERCKKTADFEWYRNILEAMYNPIAKAGKSLIVRDFAYTSEQQSLMIKACETISEDIIIALKAQPHDYYPTFPNNPEIGNTGNLREYIEFDTWGQYFGMGIAPMSLVEDIKERLEHAYEKKAIGVWFRTDWELMPDASVHNTPSLVNLYGGAMLARDLDTSLDSIYQIWVAEGLYSPMKTATQYQTPEHPSNPNAWINLRDYMKRSWEAFAKASYILGHQYLESDQAPYTIEKAFEVMVVIHSRDDWEPGASKRVSVTRENIKAIFEEKQQGIELTKSLYDILDVENLGVSEEFKSDMLWATKGMVDYALFCDATTRAMYLTTLACQTKMETDIFEAEKTVEELRTLATGFEQDYKNTFFPYYLYSRLHPQRIRRFADNVEKHIQDIKRESK